MMGLDLYAGVKTLHILGATVLFGTGLGTAFQMWMAHRSREPMVIARVARHTVLADWLFTTPAALLQPVTGLTMAYLGGYALSETWLWLSITLYVVTGLCWLPVVWIQAQMAQIAATSARLGDPLPARYHLLFRVWFALGWPAFFAVLVTVHLMVTKPV